MPQILIDTLPDGTLVQAFKPHDIEFYHDFLQGVGRRTVEACRFTFTGGVAVGGSGFTPGAGATYAGRHFVRDTAMMMRQVPEAFTDTDVLNAAKLAIASQGIVDDGIVALVNVNGQPVGFSGPAVTPSEYDGPFYALDLVETYCTRVASADFFEDNEEVLMTAFNSTPVLDHLVYIDPEGSPPPVGHGFNDSEIMTGHDANTSLDRYCACRALSRLCAMAGRTTDSNMWAEDMSAMRDSFENLLFDPTTGFLKFGTDLTNPNSLLNSLTASAYACVLGAMSSNVLDEISDAFIDLCPGRPGYKAGKRGWIYGQLRHFDSMTSGFQTFRFDPIKFLTYQNGAGWLYMTGASYAAVARRSLSAALDLCHEMIKFQMLQPATLRPVEAVNANAYPGWLVVNDTVQASVYGASNQPLQWIRSILDPAKVFDR